MPLSSSVASTQWSLGSSFSSLRSFLRRRFRYFLPLIRWEKHLLRVFLSLAQQSLWNVFLQIKANRLVLRLRIDFFWEFSCFSSFLDALDDGVKINISLWINNTAVQVYSTLVWNNQTRLICSFWSMIHIVHRRLRDVQSFFFVNVWTLN